MKSLSVLLLASALVTVGCAGQNPLAPSLVAPLPSSAVVFVAEVPAAVAPAVDPIAHPPAPPSLPSVPDPMSDPPAPTPPGRISNPPEHQPLPPTPRQPPVVCPVGTHPVMRGAVIACEAN